MSLGGRGREREGEEGRGREIIVENRDSE